MCQHINCTQPCLEILKYFVRFQFQFQFPAFSLAKSIENQFKMPDAASINRSLSTIRTELEFLQASNVLSGPQFQSIMAQLPVRLLPLSLSHPPPILHTTPLTLEAKRPTIKLHRPALQPQPATAIQPRRHGTAGARSDPSRQPAESGTS